MNRMNDLISRQDAIDAFDLPIYNIKGRENAERVVEYLKAVIQRIKDLPSAQPEIIHCAECKYQDKGSNESDSWNLCGYRPWIYVPTSDEHYCGYAERKTDE